MKTGSNAFIRAGTCCSAGKKCAQAGCGFFRAPNGCRWKSTPCGCASKGTSPGWLARSRLPARLNGALTRRWSRQRIFLFAAPSQRTPRGVADGRSGSWSRTTLLLCPPGSLPRCSSSRTRRYLFLFLDSRVLNPKLLEKFRVAARGDDAVVMDDDDFAVVRQTPEGHFGLREHLPRKTLHRGTPDFRNMHRGDWMRWEDRNVQR